MNTAIQNVEETSNSEILRLFTLHKTNQFALKNRPIKERIGVLKKLEKVIEKKYRFLLHEALQRDFGKPRAEVDLTEVYVILKEIRSACANLSNWSTAQHVPTPAALLGATSKITYEAKGVCLIISPWNFPFQLAIGPLISAIAAGNTVILKPSELTPNTANLLKDMVGEVFLENEVAVVLGGIQTSTDLLKLPFNHIFFTGSPAVGKIVMKAAAENLTSVTLELGGKSPTIIDETANLKTAAKRIAWAKFVNAGQICIAPDYILVHENVQSELIEELKVVMKKYYSTSPENSSDFSRIVNVSHFKRLKSYLDEVKKGAGKIEAGGEVFADKNTISPTIISGVSPSSALMQDEIFGPILPIITYKKIDEATQFIREREIPLALYIYSKNKVNVAKIMAETQSGGVCVNQSLLHFSNGNLPFGGANNSGIGQSHGYFGFLAFSHSRAVLTQVVAGPTDILVPPYSGFKQKLIDLAMKWF